MKISVNWMQELAGDVKILPKGGIEELVTIIGAQLGAVEGVVDLGKKYQHIVIALVVKCTKHPNADKLKICLIDDSGKTKDVKRDKDGYVQVVCGAPNVENGMYVAWLPPGSVLPKSFDSEPLILEAREIRGEMSYGMLASASELGIGDSHDGILEIDNTGVGSHKNSDVDINDHVAAMQNIEFVRKYKPGDDFAKAFGLDDYIIDIENKMFTHRPDCFGQLGVAREIAGITDQKFISPANYLNAGTIVNDKNSLEVKITNDIPELVPRFMIQVYENIEIRPSPVWMQTYLNRCGVRPINNIVDITNYFMILTGQPLHAYDADKLRKIQSASSGPKSNAQNIGTRLSRKGDKLKLLNGKEIVFEDEATILITVGDKPIGIGGVMGGGDTEVDESTTKIILECANFDMYSIRRASMKHGIFTEAVTRFNKGQSPLQCDKLLSWASGEIICHASGIPGNIYDDYKNPKSAKLLRVSTKFVNDRLGLDLSREVMKKLLENVEIAVELTDNKDEIKITPPFWRTDLEIQEDVVEEIGRLYGYDHLPLVLPKRSLRPTKPDSLLEFKHQLRLLLSKSGANEVLNYSFIHGDLIEKVGQNTKLAYKLNNAISPELQYYRLSLTPSLLDKVHMNIKSGYDKFTLFEINKTHSKQHIGEDSLPKETEKLALVCAFSDKAKPAGAPYFQARAYLDDLLSSLGIAASSSPITKKLDYQTAAPFEVGRSASIIDNETGLDIGIIGEYRASVVKALKLPQFCSGFELSTSKLIRNSEQVIYKTIPKYPKIEQDISLKVPEKVNYDEIFTLLSAELLNNPATLTTLVPVDIFQKAEDKKHVQMTFRYTVASYEKTLISEEVNELLDKAAVVVGSKRGAIRI